MGVPIVRLGASVDYWGPGVACFDPEKVIDRLRGQFPGAVVDPTDQAEREVARIDAFSDEFRADDRVKQAVRGQIRGKARRNGPVYRFHLDDGLWARIVYDFALGYRLGVLAREHILRSLVPLYLAWLASFIVEVRDRGEDDVEQRLERLCGAFEAEKPYLISKWRWPERLRT